MAAPTDPRDLRREYSNDALEERDVDPDPIMQFQRWFDDALRANVVEPNAMTLATADASGAPSARMVLLKGFDRRGFTFFGNYASRKGRELDANPRAALCIHWKPLERQVRIEGAVSRVTRQESEEYFHLRPIESQVGAIVSPQSRAIESRDALYKQMMELLVRYKGGDAPVPLPDHWGGWRVEPLAIEFWQGRSARLHDRLLYTRDAEGRWMIRRLAP